MVGYITKGMHGDELASVVSLSFVGPIVFGFVLMFGHAFKLIYPSGFNIIEWFTAAWRPSRWPGFALLIFYGVAPMIMAQGFGVPTLPTA